MKKYLVLIFVGVSCLTLGYLFGSAALIKMLYQSDQKKGKAFIEALGAAQPTAPILIDFRRLFPGAKEKMSYFAANDEPGFDVEVYLYNRYQLTMKLPVNFDVSQTRVVGFGEPAFYLNEVSKVHITEGRAIGMSFDPSGALKFGPGKWRVLVENNGDFNAIGYSMKTNSPIADFELLKAMR
jgi:hypothetical protein